MGKTHDKIKEVTGHSHIKGGGGGKLDQSALIADADILMQLWKDGKTECIYREVGEWSDNEGRTGYSLQLKGVAIKD